MGRTSLPKGLLSLHYLHELFIQRALRWVPRVVEQADDWLIQAMVVPQSTHGGRRKIQATSFESGQRDPARGEDA